MNEDSYYKRYMTSNKSVKKGLRTMLSKQNAKEEGIFENNGKYLVRMKNPSTNRVVSIGQKDTLSKAKYMFKSYKEGKKEFPKW